MSAPQAAAGAGGTLRFAPAAPGWAAWWDAAAAALAPWLGAAAGAPCAVVVPRAALVAPLRRALQARLGVAGRPWAPPPIRPLDRWADELVPAEPVDTLGRTLDLLQALDEAMPASLPQRAAADRLAFAEGLRAVLDAFELAGAAGRLDDPSWIAAVVAAFGSPAAEERLRADLGLLARVARAVATDGVDPVARSVARMRALASVWAARGTRVAWLAWQPPEPLESVALAELEVLLPPARRLRVEPDWSAIGRDAPLLAAAWPERFGVPAAPLGERRERWRAASAGRVPTVLHAADREREAQLAAQWVHGRLAQAADRGDPPPRLAIVALDRWLARRVRALLERAGVLIDDREGWLLSTTVAATAAMGWLDAVAGSGHHDDLLGWLDSRFVRPAGHTALRRWIEQRVTRHGYLRGWDGLAGDGGEPATEPVARLRALADAQARPQPLVAHLDRLERALRWADAPRRLAADAAGRQLLTLLEGLRRASAASDRGASARPLPAAEFRALLGSVLERHRFYGPVDSPVELLTPADAAGREFDAVVVLGASEGALPAAPPPLPLLNEPLRAMLGLPTAASTADRQQRDLALLLALPDAAAITCRSDAGDGTRPSPWVERIEAIAGDAPLAQRFDSPGAPRELEACPRVRPGPVFGTLPARVSVGGIERLVACPFRFLAQDGWRLREAPEAVDAPGTRERGELVHAVLERFHREAHAAGLVPGPQRRDALRALLSAATDAVAERLLGTGGGALGELAEWRATLDRYLDWACADAADGWRWAAAEQPGAARVEWDAPDGRRTVRVEGRLDRLDAGPGGLRVVDYKLGSPDRLRRIVAAPDRAAQLAMYAWIAAGHGEVAGAGYLSLRRDGVAWLPLGAPAHEVLGAWRASLPRYLARIEAGAAMTASGAECDHCASRGLCRKGHWS